MPTHLGSAFVPVKDTESAARWYCGVFGLSAVSIEPHAAVLADVDDRRVTLMGPSSGIRAEPGLPWASTSYRVDDIHAFRRRCLEDALTPTDVVGDPLVCEFFSMQDPDGNVVLVVSR